MPPLPRKRPLTVPPTRIGVVDALSMGTSFPLRQVPPRPLAKSFRPLTASLRKHSVDWPRSLPFRLTLSIAVLPSAYQRTTSPSSTLLCAQRGRPPTTRSSRQSEKLRLVLLGEFLITPKTRLSRLTSL